MYFEALYVTVLLLISIKTHTISRNDKYASSANKHEPRTKLPDVHQTSLYSGFA